VLEWVGRERCRRSYLQVRRLRVFVPSILVADDNTNIQKMVSLAFEDRGITVVAVGNGEAAVRRIPDLNPDLVLADIFMPVRNGYEVCEFVKKDQRFSHVPVILLVGAFDPLDEKEARRVGADGVLKKPFVPPDPLIAMVISALEKNPRVVAELAKAKAALEPHAMPEPAPSFELPSSLPKPEPKPLPDFPEPTPEEAALVYGFGKGVRAIDDDEQAGATKEPPAPRAARDQEDDEDLETGATASDWRRTAMDFEISDEDAGRPAFSTVDELQPAAFFPSEGAPQKSEPRVALKAEPKIEPRVEPKVEPKMEPAVAVAEETAPIVAPSVTPVIADEVDVRALEPVEVAPVQHAPIGFAKDMHLAPPVSIESRAVVPERQSEPESAPEAAKPSLASRMRHWMDALVAAPSPEVTRQEPKAEGDWMATLSEPETEPVAAVEQQPASPEPAHPTSLAVAKPAEDEDFFAAESERTEPEIAASAPFEIASAEIVPEEVAAIDEPLIEAQPAAVDAGSFEEATGTDIVPVEAHDEESKAFEETKPERQPEPSPEIWERAEETSSSLRDPDLVLPAAVHVTPEPLLVDEEPEAVSSYGEYGGNHQEAHAADTFEVAAVPEPVTEDTPAEEASLPEPSFEAAAESEVEHADERIPTGPPPNRDALAEIPFLNPPQGLDPNARAAQSSAVDASTVDAVVEKLLVKLQPQLHALLSQGVLKPLVENLLREEATKKEE
jgi:CheY-like chemotaxis protein